MSELNGKYQREKKKISGILLILNFWDDTQLIFSIKKFRLIDIITAQNVIELRENIFIIFIEINTKYFLSISLLSLRFN
jgi:hypothetical protein